MNWLAHLFLSKKNIEYRVGNLLPDFMSITELVKFPQSFQEGINCHKIIDYFTDSHPIVKNSITRIPSIYKRFGGILTDVFYDHFLAKNWDKYSSVSLHEFSEDFYKSIKNIEQELPKEIFHKFRGMCELGIFEKYQEIAGIESALHRIDLRFRRSVNLGGAISILEADYEIYQSEFAAFFQELQCYISQQDFIE